MSIEIVNLESVYDVFGEGYTKQFLSDFSCPLNPDVENFIKNKAIEFAKQGISRTHLVFMPYKREKVLVGYFTLANKVISVKAGNLSKSTKKRIARFSTYDPNLKTYMLSAPLIAQLGKNYANGYNKLITGDQLLTLACQKVKQVQFELGGRYVYLECEPKQALMDFYRSNGFCLFDSRELDPDETDLSGTCLMQMLKYIK